MKKSELKKIIKEEILNERRKLYPEDLKKGKIYLMGYKNHQWKSIFLGWKIDLNGPKMNFKDEKIGKWEAYMSDGIMCVGSSADKLIVYKEL